MEEDLMHPFWRWFVNAVALLIAALIIPKIRLTASGTSPGLNEWVTLAIVALIFGVINAIIRPIVVLLTFPLTIVTLGLFMFVINALMLMLTSRIAQAPPLVEGFLKGLELRPGYFVRREPRVRRGGRCPNCGVDYEYTTEKRVDTRLVAELIQYAANSAFDDAVLVSGDDDFVPAVEAVNALGKRVWVATWSAEELSKDLRVKCFGQLRLSDGINAFRVERPRYAERERSNNPEGGVGAERGAGPERAYGAERAYGNDRGYVSERAYGGARGYAGDRAMSASGVELPSRFAHP